MDNEQITPDTNPPSDKAPTTAMAPERKVLQPSANFAQEVRVGRSAEREAATAQAEAAAKPDPLRVPTIFRGTTHAVPMGQSTQTGIAASQMERSKKPVNWKPWARQVGMVLAAIGVLLGGFVVYKTMTGYHTRVVSSDGLRYSVRINRQAETMSAGGKTLLVGSDKAGHDMIVGVGKNNNPNDCYATKNTRVVATVAIYGQTHNLCYMATRELYAMNFTHNKNWYYLAVFPKQSMIKLDPETVRMVADSVQINP